MSDDPATTSRPDRPDAQGTAPSARDRAPLAQGQIGYSSAHGSSGTGLDTWNVDAVFRQLMSHGQSIFGSAKVARAGEPLYCFRHTAYREHMAASYLGRRVGDEEFMSVLAAAPEDASWDAVLSTAVRLRALQPGTRGAVEEMVTLARNGSGPQQRITEILKRAAIPAPPPPTITAALAALQPN